ncbi:unnamed protein product, partial [Brassica oleracea]
MFPKWENENIDVTVEKLVNFMVASKGSWKWTQECWEVEGTKPWTNLFYVKQEPSQRSGKEGRRARSRARTEAFTEDPLEPTSEPPRESSASWNGLKRKEVEQMFKDMTKVMADGFGQCVKEMKLLADRMEVVEKKVGINHKGTDSNERQIIVSDPTKHVHEPRVS